MEPQEQGSEPLISIEGVLDYNGTLNPLEDKGLYNKNQFKAFSDHLHSLVEGGTTIAADQYCESDRQWMNRHT
mgnify:FL=1